MTAGSEIPLSPSDTLKDVSSSSGDTGSLHMSFCIPITSSITLLNSSANDKIAVTQPPDSDTNANIVTKCGSTLWIPPPSDANMYAKYMSTGVVDPTIIANTELKRSYDSNLTAVGTIFW
eukprot:CAMPEP_0116044622 /NCGR_PEP_ID=MMETSP0321-20121206/27118_1 /TAXON_ID=163516 /ORGANISM="Leptocylindrus danicus var. danicus, Strain B650" /LENGTH=119 /DNA_ID=CAMNT_0003525771 /DNA_START=340 /DNA_END=699 /DNA_ORIENTATION=-